LHEFSPLQLLVAVLHELKPLQELAPIHLPFTLPACAAIGAAASIAAAAIARTVPVVFLTVLIVCFPSKIYDTNMNYSPVKTKTHI
jgi:hypothetical protein